MLQVVAATRTAMMVVVESYDAYVLEEYAGSTLACVHHGEEGVKELVEEMLEEEEGEGGEGGVVKP